MARKRIVEAYVRADVSEPYKAMTKRRFTNTESMIHLQNVTYRHHDGVTFRFYLRHVNFVRFLHYVQQLIDKRQTIATLLQSLLDQFVEDAIVQLIECFQHFGPFRETPVQIDLMPRLVHQSRNDVLATKTSILKKNQYSQSQRIIACRSYSEKNFSYVCLSASSTS